MKDLFGDLEKLGAELEKAHEFKKIKTAREEEIKNLIEVKKIKLTSETLIPVIMTIKNALHCFENLGLMRITDTSFLMEGIFNDTIRDLEKIKPDDYKNCVAAIAEVLINTEEVRRFTQNEDIEVVVNKIKEFRKIGNTFTN